MAYLAKTGPLPPSSYLVKVALQTGKPLTP
jgi:hypothetical protein